MEEKKRLDFRYVEFIRKPQIKEDDENQDRKKSGAGNIICVALDYFDVIYAKKVTSLEECMVSENDIPCEAYQSLGLFREDDEDTKDDVKADPFRVDQEYPFFAIMQVTVTPEVYQNLEKDFDIKPLESELRETISETQEAFAADPVANHGELKLKYQIYHTVNTMDFCIVLSCDRMDFPACLSARIKAKVCGSVGNANPKYAVYTVMGIYHKFISEKDRVYMHADTILVARILLDRKVYVEQQRLEELKEILCAETDKGYISTHNLPGRYELSVRIDGAGNILDMISKVLTYIMRSFTQGQEKTDDAGEKQLLGIGHEDVLQWAMRTQSARYINIRIFFNSLECLSFMPEQDISLNGVTRLSDPKVEEIFADLYKCASGAEVLRRMKDYFDKLHHLIHTYVTLYPQYDTNLNIKMLGECLICFMKLLKLHIGFVSDNKENVEDVEKNVLWALNYFQQYVRVISSVNSSSFQAPQYEIEKDECSIVKLPIAYTQFLQEMFQKYYYYRSKEKNNDGEFVYFPKYVPLVIPYMQNSSQDSDFMMLTLFGQNMADDWECVEGAWQKYIGENNGILMFIICQDMMKYKSASELIVSTFHEMGHYCNGLTRKERNSDLIAVLSEEIAKAMTKRALAYSKASYRQMVAAMQTSPAIAWLYECIYQGILRYFTDGLSAYIQLPKGVFLEKMWNLFCGLTNEFADCGNTLMFCERFLDDDFDDIAFCFGYQYEADKRKEEQGDKQKDKQMEAAYCLQKKFDEAISGVNACSLAMNDAKMDEKVREHMQGHVKEYVNCANEMIKDAFKTNSENNGTNERAMFKEKQNHMAKCAGELAAYMREHKEVDVAGLRDSLEMSKQVLELCLQFSDHIALQKAVEENEQWVSNSKLEAYAEKRGAMLDDIWVNYMKEVPAVTENAPLSFLELYSEMHISEESRLKDFKTYMNRVISGLSVSEAVLELAKSNYEESIADIVMCVNLDLGVKEYLAFVSDMYGNEDNKLVQSVPRFVIVISYLMYVRGGNESQSVKDKSQNAEDLLKKVDQSFIEDFQTCMEEFDDKVKQASEKLCNTLQRQNVDMQRSKLFRITLCRAAKLGNKVQFTDMEDDNGRIQDFVKRSLGRKLDKDIDKHEIQYDEIQFILKYYYKNRVQYAKKTQNTKEGSSDGVESKV